jgi:hypothetical protein
MENKGETLLWPSATARQASGPERQIESNQVTTSQIETTHQTSQRQVATGLSRNDSKGPGKGLPHPALLRQGRLGGRHRRQVESR